MKREESNKEEEGSVTKVHESPPTLHTLRTNSPISSWNSYVCMDNTNMTNTEADSYKDRSHVPQIVGSLQVVIFRWVQ